ncbi:hypothetical protein BGZ65_008009, partial [Modicella reniformis]
MEHRESLRSKALVVARKGIEDLEGRIKRNVRLRKRHFLNIRKHQEARAAFARQRLGILVYHVPGLLKCLQITRPQLQVFYMVSKNDYNQN